MLRRVLADDGAAAHKVIPSRIIGASVTTSASTSRAIGKLGPQCESR
jgi:hypothetical protein